MALGVRYLGAEGRAEGVHIAEGHGEVFAVELAGNGQVRALAEEVLGEIDLAVLGAGKVIKVEGRDPEHLACTLAVRARDDGRVDIDKATLLEELMHRLCRYAAHSEHCRKQVGAGTQVLNGAQKLHTVALFLQGVVGGGSAFNGDLGGLELKRLLCLGGEDQFALADERCADILTGKLIVVGKLLTLKDYLQALECAAVVELDKAEVFHITDGACPAADGYLLTAEGLRLVKDLNNFSAFHR